MNVKIGQRYVGKLRGKVFVTHRKPQHFFVKYNGFGLSTQALDYIKKHDVEKVVIIYHKANGEQEAYWTYPNKFYEKGDIYLFGERDYQRILPLDEFVRD